MRIGTRAILASAAMLALSTIAASAVGRPTNLRGTIISVQGDTINIKERDGGSAQVHLASAAKIVSVAKATLSDIKPGDFIGTAATPRTDGTLQAIEVHIFPKSLRGTGEGNHSWDLGPKSSMTNGTVARPSGRVADNKVNKVEGDKLIVDYNGGAKTVSITPSTKVVRLVPGSRSELKPDAKVFIPRAKKGSDGAFEASLITVGKDGVAPPM
jgi:hypothetical protein